MEEFLPQHRQILARKSRLNPNNVPTDGRRRHLEPYERHPGHHPSVTHQAIAFINTNMGEKTKPSEFLQSIMDNAKNANISEMTKENLILHVLVNNIPDKTEINKTVKESIQKTLSSHPNYSNIENQKDRRRHKMYRESDGGRPEKGEQNRDERKGAKKE